MQSEKVALYLEKEEIQLIIDGISELIGNLQKKKYKTKADNEKEQKLTDLNNKISAACQ